MAMGGRTDLRLAEPVPATAGALRKASGYSRGILVLGVCADLLALPASRLGGGLKLALPAMHKLTAAWSLMGRAGTTFLACSAPLRPAMGWFCC
jgi:hypothetical protein